MHGNQSSLRNELGEFEKAELEEKMDSKEAKENKNREKGTAEKEQITDSIDVKESSTATSEFDVKNVNCAPRGSVPLFSVNQQTECFVLM